jgi:opacity protein-like surface antigen
MKAFGRLLLAGVAGTLVSGPALAQDRPAAPYLSVFGGYGLAELMTNFINNDPQYLGERFQYITGLDGGALIGGAIGFNLRPDALRTEIEIGRMAFNANEYFGITQGGQGPPIVGEGVTGFARATTVMANVWLTVHPGEVETYIGGGLGLGILAAEVATTNDGDQFDGTALGLSFQFGAGVIFPLGNSVSIDLGYRFRGVAGGRLNSSVFDFDANVEVLRVHVGLLGFTFGY